MEFKNMTENEHTINLTITTIEPLGFGNPDSSISLEKKLKSGELNPEIDASAQEFLTSGEGLVAVHEHDDGCIDGRCTEKLYLTKDLGDDNQELFVTEAGEFYLRPSDSSNHERAKVAGGGYITGQAIRIGAGMRGDTIESDIATLTTDLAAQDVYCGAHTGAHMQGEGTDCGANDKMKLILENATTYKEELRGATKALLGLVGLQFDDDTFNTVVDNWSQAASSSYFEGSTGKSRLNTVLAGQAAIAETGETDKQLSVTKHLKGDHNEAYIVVNFVEGTTLSQNALLEKLREAHPGVPDEQLPQAFVVDGWRVAELTTKSVDEDKQEAGLYAGVIYQLATAATLTDGSLKIFAYTE